MSKEKPIFIYIFPYKFTEFNYYLAELDNYKNETKLEVWDISPIINRDFSKEISSPRSSRKEVITFISISSYFSKLRKIKKISKYREIIFLSEMVWDSPRAFFLSLVFFVMMKNTKIKLVDFFNGGVPLNFNDSSSLSISFYRKAKLFLKNTSSVMEFNRRFVNFVLVKISAFFESIITHRLVAGEQWLKYIQNQNKKKQPELIYGHSNDFSHYLKEKNKKIFKKNKTAVFLDSAGPAFTSDSALTGRKVYFTSDKWYPSLCNFFDFVESKTFVEVKILGHYKSNHISKSPIFGGREIIYGETLKMIKECDYVITRNSTAISFAVLFKKPVIFVFSNQLVDDREAIENIFGFSHLLGTSPINIDEKNLNIEALLDVDEKKYSRYIELVLSSNSTKLSNSEIILQKFNINESPNV